MRKPTCDDSQPFDRSSSPNTILPPPSDFNMNWQTVLSQSDPSIQSRQNQLINRLSTTAYNSSSYKVSIGHETVNITEIARHHDPSSDSTPPIISTEQRRAIETRKSVNILSLCFMCFVSVSLILIAISTMNLLFKTHYTNNNDMFPSFFQSVNMTPGYLYMFATPILPVDTVSNLFIPNYDRLIRDLAMIICLLIIVLNCYCLLVFSIEIYLGCNMTTTKLNTQQFSILYNTSTSRFAAICSFYASIPALILVMCLFILLNMSLIPAIISLIVLGLGLIFILITLLSYFSSWKTNNNNNLPTINEKITGINSSVYHSVGGAHLTEDIIDLANVDELSTLV